MNNVVLTDASKKGIQESLKEVGRYVISFLVSEIVANLPIIASVLPTKLPVYLNGGSEPVLYVNVSLIVVFILTMIIRGADKYMHVSLKESRGVEGKPLGFLGF